MAFLLLGLPMLAATHSQWALQQSTLTYHISHPLHSADGTSHAARGKGVCQAGECNFLIAVPVNTFTSGDSNRDLHMLQVTRGAQFPLVSVRTQVPEAELKPGSISANLEIQFAGQTVQYQQVPIQVAIQGNTAHITGTIPAKVSDFKIQPPTLLTIPIKNDMPIAVDMTWQGS